MKADPKRDVVDPTASFEAKKRASAKGYLQEVKEELKKVSWPLADELKMCTKIVISSTFIFGLAIYVTDLVVKGMLDGIAVIAKAVFG